MVMPISRRRLRLGRPGAGLAADLRRGAGRRRGVAGDVTGGAGVTWPGKGDSMIPMECGISLHPPWFRLGRLV